MKIELNNPDVITTTTGQASRLIRPINADTLKQDMVDTIPVVRCKDCKHCNDGFCESIDGLTGAVKKEDYCSRGERNEL